MTEAQLLDTILGGGGGIALIGLLLYLYFKSSKEAAEASARYITHLEEEIQDLEDRTQPRRVTRPVPRPDVDPAEYLESVK